MAFGSLAAQHGVAVVGHVQHTVALDVVQVATVGDDRGGAAVVGDSQAHPCGHHIPRFGIDRRAPSDHTSSEPCPMARSIDNNSERDPAPIRRRIRATWCSTVFAEM
ncbi:hypothetical protein CJ468_05946 [Nocardia farcinica]|nr:hypothetical protein CJ468_05946 [Nocardia farcinica]